MPFSPVYLLVTEVTDLDEYFLYTYIVMYLVS